MASMIVHHKVKDYDAWKPFFDGHEATRTAGGSTGYTIFRSVDDPNDLAILMQWDSIENAKKFASSEDLKNVMHKAGVIGKPDVYFLG